MNTKRCFILRKYLLPVGLILLSLHLIAKEMFTLPEFFHGFMVGLSLTFILVGGFTSRLQTKHKC